MSSDEWRNFLAENFKDEGDVALSLEDLTLEQIHGFLGIAERRLLAYTKDKKDEGCMPHIVMWKINDIRQQLIYQRNALAQVIGYDTWLKSVIDSARRGESKDELIARLERRKREKK